MRLRYLLLRNLLSGHEDGLHRQAPTPSQRFRASSQERCSGRTMPVSALSPAKERGRPHHHEVREAGASFASDPFDGTKIRLIRYFVLSQRFVTKGEKNPTDRVGFFSPVFWQGIDVLFW